MSTHADFLVEIGTEELPPKALKKLAKAFVDGIEHGLKDAELDYSRVQTFATPRRLAVKVVGLQTVQQDKTIERKGPAKKAGFDADGNPTKALEGFARGCGVSVDELIEIETDKGVWMAYNLSQKGQSAQALLPDIVEQSLSRLPIPKRMRWGDSSVEFVRPVHWVLMMLGSETVPATILGQTAGNVTYGHRFHAPQAIELSHPEAYESALKQACVMADYNERVEMIRTQVLSAAEELGGQAEIDEDLLEEVTALNEWPHAVVGDFDERFLEVPSEALISAMKGHQKYFHLRTRDGGLMAKFITISNIDSRNPQAVKQGNERVIRPRLSDAKFFWDQDLKQPLEHFLPRLQQVVFQQKLGTVMDKVERLQTLTVFIGQQLGEAPEKLERAARLSKCDLMSEMVGEFPELQGVMGHYYAKAQKEDAGVAQAIEAQYQPRFAGDDLPDSVLAQSLAIADKLDTITGIYGLGQVPTGDKDPFALRRSALGLLRIIIEKSLDLDLNGLIAQSLALHSGIEADESLKASIYDFIMSRLKAYYADQGITAEQFEAVRACQPAYPLDFARRIDAVRQFSGMEEAESLSAANKRIANILKQVDAPVSEGVNTDLFECEEETQLAQALGAVEERLQPLMAARDYAQAFAVLATMREPVDAFFDQVRVMADNEAVKQNRLALLNRIYQRFVAIADISRLS